MYSTQCLVLNVSRCSMLMLFPLPFSWGFTGLMGSLKVMMGFAEGTKVISIWSVCDPNIYHRPNPHAHCMVVTQSDGGGILSLPGSACRGCYNWGGLQQLQCPRGKACVWRVQRWLLSQLPGSPLRESFQSMAVSFWPRDSFPFNRRETWGSELLGQLANEASQSQPIFWSSLGVNYPKYLGYGEGGLVKDSSLEVGVLAICFLDLGSLLSCPIPGPIRNALHIIRRTQKTKVHLSFWL